MTGICTSQISELSHLKDIFIELTAKNCNKRCNHCYIDLPFNKNVKDFIKIDIIKKTFEEFDATKLNCIYFVGAEPMSHPDFNSILRYCLKYSNVCISTNATFINEKKARFLKNVESEFKKSIIFKLSFAHYDEDKNDAVRFRGAYRQNVYALKCLNKYDFTNILCVSNYYKEPQSVITNMFTNKMNEWGLDNGIVQVNEWCDLSETVIDSIDGKLDCMTSRTLTSTGVYSCPFLANDYRGRTGSDFTNFSKTVRLESNFCAACVRNKDKIFSLDIEW